MKAMEVICAQLAAGEFDFTAHAFKRAVERDISLLEIQQAGATAILVEDYPDDKYAPSALLLGFTAAQRPLHLHVSCADTPLTRLITLYEPGVEEWSENYAHRR